MRYRSSRHMRVIMGAIALLLMVTFQVVAIEQRNEVSFLYGPYSLQARCQFRRTRRTNQVKAMSR